MTEVWLDEKRIRTFVLDGLGILRVAQFDLTCSLSRRSNRNYESDRATLYKHPQAIIVDTLPDWKRPLLGFLLRILTLLTGLIAMRKFILPLTPAIIGGLLGSYFILSVDRTEMSNVADCPLQVSDGLAKALGKRFDPELWTIYRHDGETRAPVVRVRRNTSDLPDPQTAAVCELKIVSAPQRPEKALDWRIGNVTENPMALRGKTVTYRITYKASAPVDLDTGSFYLYDGKNVAGVPFTRAGTEWQTATVTKVIDQDATAFEVWVRLLIDKGTIKPAGVTLYLSAAVEVDGL